ncbi:MAG: hypothetical protein V3U46_03895, partial [Acidimicrobiia bacterium]
DIEDHDLDFSEDVEEDSSETTGSPAADSDSGEGEKDDEDTEPGDDSEGDSSTTENDRRD